MSSTYECVSGSTVVGNNMNCASAADSTVQSNDYDYTSGCCCSFQISLIPWKECDTLSKKVGFIAGKAFHGIDVTFSHIYSFISKTVKFLRIDKASSFVWGKIVATLKKVYHLVSWIFRKCVKPILINKVTRSIFNKINKEICRLGSSFKNSLVAYLESRGEKVASKKYENLDRPEKMDSELQKIFKSAFRNFGKVMSKVCDWTVTPFFDHLFTFGSDIVQGVSSGAFYHGNSDES